MNANKIVGRLGWAVTGAILLLAFGPMGHGSADAICPYGMDACLVVNTITDTMTRDEALSLREAIALVNGELQWQDLSLHERLQIIDTSPENQSFRDNVQIQFSTSLAQQGQPIVLLSGSSLHLLPTVQSQNAVSNPVLETRTWRTEEHVPMSPPSIGRGPGPGMVLNGTIGSVKVILDGTGLVSGAPCLSTERESTWIRGLSFRNCSVGVAVRSDVVTSTLIGSNGDGVEDDLEQVVFDPETVGTNVLIY